MKKLHMSEALQYLKDAQPQLISRSVRNEHLGVMGAESVETYHTKEGVVMRMVSSMGGCTLEIDE